MCVCVCVRACVFAQQYASKLVTPATVRDGMEEVAQPASSCSCETVSAALFYFNSSGMFIIPAQACQYSSRLLLSQKNGGLHLHR